MNNALKLARWDPEDELSRYFNVTGSSSVSWVHIAASDKYKAPLNEYTIEVCWCLNVLSRLHLRSLTLSPNAQVWFQPQGWWMSKAYLIASEELSLSFFDFDSEVYPAGCGGILLELRGGLCFSYPADQSYSSCHCGPKVLTAEVVIILELFHIFNSID
jgi:hypothetical protein